MRGVPKAGSGSLASEPAPRQVFGRARRLLRRAQFEQLLRAGDRQRAGPIEVRFAASPTGEARLGVVIGRRAVPLAVRRNRIRRLIREGFRRREWCPCDMVIRVLRAPADEDELQRALGTVWQRLGRP